MSDDEPRLLILPAEYVRLQISPDGAILVRLDLGPREQFLPRPVAIQLSTIQAREVAAALESMAQEADRRMG